MRAKYKIGDKVKLHPNKKHTSQTLRTLEYDRGYIILETQAIGNNLYHTIKIDNGLFWNIYDYKLKKVVE